MRDAGCNSVCNSVSSLSTLPNMDDLELTQSLCTRCKTIDLPKYFSASSDPETISLDYFQRILRNQHCPLCKLVVGALSVHAQPYWEHGTYPVEMCYLGRFNGDSTQPRLEVWFHATTETMPEGHSGHQTVLGGIQLLGTAVGPTGNLSASKTGARLLGPQVDYQLVRSWVKDCAENHGKRCNTRRVDLDKPWVLLLLDVERMRLVKRGWDCRYLALSYVWGGTEQFLTMRNNFEELQEDGALSRIRGDLSPLVNSAIDFVTGIGEVYLWIDALCIVQDDIQSQNEYIPRMDKIYGGSALTMIDLYGRNTSSVLPGVTIESRRSSLPSPVQVGSLVLVPELPHVNSISQSSKWASRAWTFQEGILSTKHLHFSESQVYWQCPALYRSEDGFESSRAGKIAARNHNPLERETGNDPSRQFIAYEGLVKQYAWRSSTYPSDSLRAFAGILSAINHRFGWTFVSGLPEHAFDLALLWSPMRFCKLRPRDQQGRHSAERACNSPTWCWTAWIGHIYWDPWRLGSYVGKRVTIKSEIQEFKFQSRLGLRKIAPVDCDPRTGSQSVTSRLTPALETVSVRETLSENALFFEAVALGLGVYTVSLPQLQSSGLPLGSISDYFQNESRCQMWIYDAAGYHCGILKGLESWNVVANLDAHELVLLSSSGQDRVTQADIAAFHEHLPLEYPSAEEYYAEIFDVTRYEYQRWWALNIMLIRWKGDVAERVAVGQMHVDAWDKAREQMKTIILV